MITSLVVDADSAPSSSFMSWTAPTTWNDATTLRAESVGGDKWADEDYTTAIPVVDAGSASSSSSRNIGQFSQEEQQKAQSAPGYRSVVASPATRRAANRRRKDPNKPGAHICQYCGSDFTARHNLKLHLKSHLSIKEHECEQCAQRFSTPQTLQRHKRSSTCSRLGRRGKCELKIGEA
ncbi:hypothetical protein B0H14DRAFT_2760548 [Mycena olivaceomarginata]|nr:hypothetical protein B0H14DRAFT_2760548 [Mycena olivaceomarginata]